MPVMNSNIIEKNCSYKRDLNRAIKALLTAGFLLLSLPLYAQQPLPVIEGELRSSEPQEISTNPFIVSRGVWVEHHPNGYLSHEHASPKTALSCDPPLPPATCARVMWNTIILPEVDEVYEARVPAIVRLSGAGQDVLWAPFVHCMVHDLDRGWLSLDHPDIVCHGWVDSEQQRMEWFIGGQIEGLDEERHGIYEGMIPLTLTLGDRSEVIDVPVRYELFPYVPSCPTFGGSPSVDIYAPASVGGRVDIFVQGALSSTSRFGVDNSDLRTACDTGARCTASAGSFIIQGRRPGQNVNVTIPSVDIGRGSQSESWIHRLGNYNADGDWELVTTSRGFTFDQDDIYWDDDGDALMLLGGYITFPDTWGEGTYTGSMTITMSCMP